MISKYHKTFVWDKLKIVRKFKCVQLVLVLVNVSDEKNYDSWKYTSSKERSRCQRKWRLFLSSSCSLEGETSDEKHKEISKYSVQLVLVLVNVSDEKNYDSWKYTSSKERSRCQRKWRLFLSSSCSLEGETSDEKHKEISKSSPSLFQKNPKDFGLPLFAIFNFFNAKFSRVISSSDLTD